VPSFKRRGYESLRLGSAADGPGTFAKTSREMPIGTYEQVTREVCEPCNTGWMAQQIEANARPTMIEIFEGGSPRLTYRNQRALAAWGWKTAAMITLLADKESRCVWPKEYAWFREKKTPPPRAAVWVGAYDGKDFKEHWSPWATTIRVLPPQAPTMPEGVSHNAYSVPFTVGNIFFLVFGTAEPVVPALGPRGELAEHVRQIWPVAPGRSFMWPKDAPVTDPVIASLVESFFFLGKGGGLANGIPGAAWGPIGS
jgi:hypothetical protein